MISINPKDISPLEMQYYLQNAVAPRPIALASTINAKGEVNLSPFSFFNCFSSNPPILVFSPARRVRDNTTKHTLENVKEVKEVVINTVDFSMAEQMSLSSTEYDAGVNEFLKSGFTPGKSQVIQPPYVQESPVAFECKVNDIIALGDSNGAGNLIIAEVVYIHVNEKVISEGTKINLEKLDLIARMGGSWYCRTTQNVRFEIPKPLTTKGIGVDSIPEHIRFSKILSGNDLGRLGNVEHLPDMEEVQAFSNETNIRSILTTYANNKEQRHEALQHLAKTYLSEMKLKEAWMTLLQD
ncbi:NADH-FMN oxidoreductase RutF, flavin reductase (DIM6/NTAB) family [Pustulibacterium marinum]|uniref:NADH-FMN oxidoreductase RutF, flavin reductase (DIM6/NTAB) family n=1 Tax=Pustulibacterium marinum TaxID=1224947 RepID=A0A1I7IAD3_9FLAO|nr:flavin reductase family protein [Pustulibacterium marinum]SFU69800.1 NADH-FMN oxidoreductase RutF, flavin reductase (DIM6/NTAB) family [Pustulibacterium marinum]